MCTNLDRGTNIARRTKTFAFQSTVNGEVYGESSSLSAQFLGAHEHSLARIHVVVCSKVILTVLLNVRARQELRSALA